jgi:hypothetical protein
MSLMNSMLFPAAAAAATPLAAPPASPTDAPVALVAAAKLLLADLERGRAIDAHVLRAAMTTSFGASDSEGAWTWKTAYDACEAAQVLFVRKFEPAMRERAAPPSAFLAMLAKLGALLPSHTRRSEESQAFQQFSTRIGLASSRARPQQSRPPIWCWSPRRAPGSSPSMPSSTGAAWF